MPIYTQANEAKQYIEEMPLGTGEAVGASFLQTFQRNPVTSLFVDAKQLYSDYVEQSPVIDAETARKRVEQEGLKLTIPDDGIKENVLNILMENKYQENRLKSILERGPDGFVTGLATFGASVGASLLDPINIAAAFVPVYGQVRYTSLLANAAGAVGRAGVRARVGAVEGFVGAALVEPIVYFSAQYQQADYTMTESLEALAFGTIFGGGLHMGVGALGDAFRRTGSTLTAKPDGNVGRILNSLEPETRVDVFNGAVGQVLSGRQIDIEARLQMDPIFRNTTARALESTSLTPIGRTSFTLQEPPVPPGMTRLYHGSSTPGRLDGKAWFSTDRKYAESYRPGAELQYVDYPTSKVNAALDPDGYGQTVDRGFTWNVELDSSETGLRKIVSQTSTQTTSTIGNQLSTPEVALNSAVNPGLVEPPLRAVTGAMDSSGNVPVYQTAREAERIRDKVLKNRGEQLEVRQLPDGTYTLLRPYDAQPVRNPDGTPMSFDTERAAAKASKSITDLKDRNLTPVAFMEEGQMKFALVENAPKGMAAAAKKNPELVDLGLAMDRSINAESKLIDEEIAKNRVQKAYERMRESYRAENLRLADMEAVRSVDDTYAVAMRPEKPDMPVDDLDAIVEEARRVGDALGLRAEFDAEMAKYDALIQDADAVGRGFEAAALCGLRRG